MAATRECCATPEELRGWVGWRRVVPPDLALSRRKLMRDALDRCAAPAPSTPGLLDAQAHLAPWSAVSGFEVAVG